MKHFYHTHINIDERSVPPEDEVYFQPYLPEDAQQLNLAAVEHGAWVDPMAQERMALALSQITAQHICCRRWWKCRPGRTCSIIRSICASGSTLSWCLNCG